VGSLLGVGVPGDFEGLVEGDRDRVCEGRPGGELRG